MSRNREPLASLFLYRAFKYSVVNPMLRFYFQGRIYGAENVPQSGALVIVSNHASNYDPPIVSNCVRRPVSYMAKEELFKIPLLKQAIQLYGAYPVQRGTSDRNAIRMALEHLEQGWAVGLFLQGTRTSDGRITDPKRGAALIAAKSKAPIIPVCLWGTQEIERGKTVPQRVPVTVRIGEVIPAPTSTTKEHLESVTQECAIAINKLHDLGR